MGVNARQVKLLGFLTNSFISCVSTFGATSKTISFITEQLDRLENLGQLTPNEKTAFKRFIKDGNMQRFGMLNMVVQSLNSKSVNISEAKLTELLTSYYKVGMIDKGVVLFIGIFFAISVDNVLREKGDLNPEDVFIDTTATNFISKKVQKDNKHDKEQPISNAANRDLTYNDVFDHKEQITYNAFLNSDYYVLARLAQGVIPNPCSNAVRLKYIPPKAIDKDGLDDGWEYSGLYEKRRNPNYDGCSGSEPFVYKEANVTLNDLAVKWIMRWKYTDARKPRVDDNNGGVNKVSHKPEHRVVGAVDPCGSGLRSRDNC